MVELKEGDRIELQKMGDDPHSGRADPNPVEPGMRGEVGKVTRLWDGTIHVEVDWDNGRNLAVILPVDQVFKLPTK